MASESEPRKGCFAGCCSGKNKQVNLKGYGSAEKQQEDPNTPSCCKNKPSPCCDVSCLDRIALRQCDSVSPNDASPKPPNASCKRPDGKPCDQHSRSARAEYAGVLEALGCICRALIALGQESCCTPPRGSSSGNERHSADSSRAILRISIDSCCERYATVSDRRRSANPKGKGKACSGSCCGSPKAPASPEKCVDSEKKGPIKSGSCCGKPKASEAGEQHMPLTESCCGKSKCEKPLPTSCGKGEANTNSCSAGCCGEPTSPFGALSQRTPNDPCKRAVSGCAVAKESPRDSIEVIPRTAVPDLEKGFLNKEHIILSISGMTCTGCETKLKRTLGTLESVQNLKTSLVLSRAEFDLDVSIQSLDKVFRHLKKITEFEYERVTDRGSQLDILVPNTSSEFVKQDWPRGVTEMTVVDEQTVNVSFDAKIIGSRDLLEHGWDIPLRLAPPRPDATLAAGNKHVRHIGYMTILSIILTVPVLVLSWAPLPEREITYGSVSLALATIVQVIIAGPFYPKAFKALIFSRIIEMDLLIVLSTSAAYIFSVISYGYLVVGNPPATGEFFETSTLLVTLIMVGRYVVALARQKAVESISLHSLQTPTAILVDESGPNEKQIDVRLLQYGDIFKVIPDTKIPTDGTVIGGSSEVNESMVTGESIPVEKSPGSTIAAGSVNGSGTLIAKLTRLPADNTIAVIAGMVDQAKLSKPKIQDFADRVASYFVPVIVTLTIVTFVIWIAVGIAVRNQSGSRATTEAITYAITVLVVSCPCAISLAVPMVIVIASGVAAERGIIFKAADSIAVVYKISHVVFDKTGTVTRGNIAVVVEHADNTNGSMALLLGLISGNKHPISAAVATHLTAKGISASTVTDTTVLTGKGVEGVAPGLILRAGNSRWLNLLSNPQVQSVLDQGYTAFCFTINGDLAAVFGLVDLLRPDALETVTKLQERGISVHLISGDDTGPVNSIARQLDIRTGNTRSRCTPADKQAYIQALASPPHEPPHTKTPIIMFVGDGTNDAVALASSTIGVHINQETGSDVAKSAADVVLMRPSLLSILTMINISEKAVRRIKFNFGWSFVYNLFAVLLGAGAFVNARIPTEFAGMGELVSVLPVVVAAVLLRWARV
ncbi:copper-transporting ATPase, putative [Talaromyces stipitatus ATCC 10500]|uniref:Copper-transporting ATPase, putative n=1 Tax=Talaromyces stipitatus (strain ATCC 10500 / CBS 375.48 / QM 6759 / NRRL 1006) TaxID=441959 RepID=B8MIG2_TALSN|nr:copper-transporting ATPase, putative [Talaromyces stipitatus ATCC 10500]EED14646.1 copper-transporting ATPase, putative [Talaromyces stipitatus ATCC 10500]